MTDYAAACVAATTAQGLDPVIAALTAADIDHRVEQTGGMTMVVVVPRNTRTYAVTFDGGDTGYVVGTYTNDGWKNAGDALSYDDGMTAKGVIKFLSHPFRRPDYSGRRGRRKTPKGEQR